MSVSLLGVACLKKGTITTMATTQTTQTAQTTQQTSSQFTRVMRIVYMVTVWGFIAGLFLQFFFAGLSIFVGSTWWDTHNAFGRAFGVTTVLLLLFALAGRLPRRQIVMTAILIPLYVLQILLIELPGRLGVIAVSALHPVNAGVMLGLAIVLAHRAWKATRAKAEIKEISREQARETGDAAIIMTAPRATTSMHDHS